MPLSLLTGGVERRDFRSGQSAFEALDHGNLRIKVDAALEGTNVGWSRIAENILYNYNGRPGVTDKAEKSIKQWENSAPHYAVRRRALFN